MGDSLQIPGHTQIVGRATAQFPRHSEGDIIALDHDRLMLAWGRKSGPEDFDPATIISSYSDDGGKTWGEPQTIIAPWGEISDVMSVSLCRTPRGLHLFFLGRGPLTKEDLRVFQIISDGEGSRWSEPEQINLRYGYHVMNNARVLRLESGRLLAPVAFTGDIEKSSHHQCVFCLYSDDDGCTWQESGVLQLEGHALMEPGVAQCADGSIYMTIRTALGVLYEARSSDSGESWHALQPTTLVSPAAPSTVVRDPNSAALWMFWCNNQAGATAGWRDRNPQAVAISHDCGRSWSTPRILENDETKGFGYFSVDVVKEEVHLTYYDWSREFSNFYMCHLRHRVLPIDWFDENSR